jgi:hypothetical protein
MLGVRKALFGLQGVDEPGETWTMALMSPLRVFSDGATGFDRRGSEYYLQTNLQKSKNSVLMLATAYPIEIEAALNIAIRKVESALGFTEVLCNSPNGGQSEFKLTLPSYGKPPPKYVAAPKYSEERR